MASTSARKQMRQQHVKSRYERNHKEPVDTARLLSIIDDIARKTRKAERLRHAGEQRAQRRSNGTSAKSD